MKKKNEIYDDKKKDKCICLFYFIISGFIILLP